MSEPTAAGEAHKLRFIGLGCAAAFVFDLVGVLLGFHLAPGETFLTLLCGGLIGALLAR